MENIHNINIAESVAWKQIYYTPEIQHGTWKWWFPIGVSFSKGPFSGSMFVLGGVLFSDRLPYSVLCWHQIFDDKVWSVCSPPATANEHCGSQVGVLMLLPSHALIPYFDLYLQAQIAV